MRAILGRLIYNKWFFAVLAAMFWYHFATDVDDVIKTARWHEILSLVISGAGAVGLTIIFLDLHFRWPSKGR